MLKPDKQAIKAFSELTALQLLNPRQCHSYHTLLQLLRITISTPHPGTFDPAVLAALLINHDLTIMRDHRGPLLVFVNIHTGWAGKFFIPEANLDTFHLRVDMAIGLLREDLADAVNAASGKMRDFANVKGGYRLIAADLEAMSALVLKRVSNPLS